jgi:hypothetical protein
MYTVEVSTICISEWPIPPHMVLDVVQIGTGKGNFERTLLIFPAVHAKKFCASCLLIASKGNFFPGV